MGRKGSRRPRFERSALACLEGGGLLLRPPQLGDARQLYSYAANPLASRWLAWAPHRDEGESVRFMLASREAWQGEECLPWVILANGLVVGMIEVKLKGRNAGIGYVIAPAEWGKGVASRALSLVSEALFRHTSVNAIWALCVTENLASARVLEKCGYQCESLIPHYLPCPNLGGGKHDVWRYVRYRYPIAATQRATKPV